MIGKDKNSIYQKYNGDGDVWVRLGNKMEKEIMSDKDWYEIDNILLDISLTEKNILNKIKSRIKKNNE